MGGGGERRDRGEGLGGAVMQGGQGRRGVWGGEVLVAAGEEA